MDDQRLDNLIRMAVEIDELERGALDGSRTAHGPSLRLVGQPARSSVRHRRHQRIWQLKVIGLATAAACVGMAVRLAITPSAPPTPGSIAGSGPNAEPERVVVDSREPSVQSPDESPEFIATAASASSAEASIVLGIFEDAAGVVRCVKWREHDFGGRDLDDVRPGELTAATYGQQCVIGPHKVIAVGLSGPKDELPETDAQAQAVAQCIMGVGPQTCEVHPSSYDSKSMTCLPNGLRVVVETMAMGQVR